MMEIGPSLFWMPCTPFWFPPGIEGRPVLSSAMAGLVTKRLALFGPSILSRLSSSWNPSHLSAPGLWTAGRFLFQERRASRRMRPLARDRARSPSRALPRHLRTDAPASLAGAGMSFLSSPAKSLWAIACPIFSFSLPRKDASSCEAFTCPDCIISSTSRGVEIA